MNDMNMLVDEFENSWPGFSTFDQLGIVVLDGSMSMADIEKHTGMVKAEAATHAFGEVVGRMQISDMNEQFMISLVTFDDNVKCPIPPTYVNDVDDSDLEIDLLEMHGRNTAIGDALEKARQIAEDFLADEDPDGAIPRYVVILLMSDGQNNSGADPRVIAQQIKDQFTETKRHGPQLVLATAGYGDDADENLLREIASGEDNYKRVEDGEALRDFFIATISVAMTPMETATI